MTAVAVVLALRERLKRLFLDDTTQKYSGSFKEEMQQMNSKFVEIEAVLKMKEKNLTNYKKEESSNSEEYLEDLAIPLAYELEDSIECMALQSSSSKSKLGSVKSVLHKLSTTKSHQNVDFRSLKERIDKLSKACREYAAGKTAQSGEDVIPCVVNFPQNIFVGREDDLATLRGLLQDDNNNANAISLCGIGGIGKTTLARKLFDDPSLVKKFDCRAWARVGKIFRARDIATVILADLTGSTKEELQLIETTELMERLYKAQDAQEAQEKKKCLVVLDDVCSLKAWYTIRFALATKQGTKIIITTRDPEVASHIKGYIHKMELLNEKHGWDLFSSLSGMQDEVGILQNPNIEEEMKKIAHQCLGLPLTITMIGGMLRAKMLDLAEASDMLKEYQNNDTSLEAILELSYKHLPVLLKPCFLYMAYFPSDYVIELDKLYLLWMAEGLVSEKQGKTRMETAKNYLSALVQTSLVMLHSEDFSGTPMCKTCELHDMMYDLCLKMGSKEGSFGKFDHEPRKILFSKLRVVINLDNYESGDHLKTFDLKLVRSLFFFSKDGSSLQSTWPTQVADLKEFRSARVLDFDGVAFQSRKLPKGIEKLIFVRYLSFRGCYLDDFPSTFGNFPYLETLDLRVRTSCIIPNIFSKMSSLLHLYFPLAFQNAIPDKKLKLDSLIKLEILENFHAGMCEVDDLPKLKNLKILKVIADGNNEDIHKMIKFIHGCGDRLHHSSLALKNFDCYSKERNAILAELLNCDHFHALDIEGHLGSLIRDERLGFNFTELVFKGSEFEEDPMPILGKLEHLTSLVLCNDAFLGEKMKCSKDDFPKLRCLTLANLWFLTEWVVESGAMPCFSSLTVEQCPNLKTLPDEMMEKTTLKEVKMRQMSKVFQKIVHKMAKQQRTRGNEVVVRCL